MKTQSLRAARTIYFFQNVSTEIASTTCPARNTEPQTPSFLVNE
jgi:hypothetical protein